MRKISVQKTALLLALTLAVACAYIYRDIFSQAALQALLTQAGWWAPLLYIGVYALATVLFLPGSVLTLAGGALFGPWFGTLYSLTGATLGASIAFLLARYVMAEWVQQRAGKHTAPLIRGIDDEGWRFVAFVRLVPLFPFNLLNYALGLTRIPLWHYVLTSFICMAPGALAYTYLGFAGREGLAGDETALKNGLIAMGLIVLVIYSARLLKRYHDKRTATNLTNKT